MALSELLTRQLLLKSKLVDKATLADAWESARHLGCPLADVLIGRGSISDEAYGAVISKYYRVKFADLPRIRIPQHVLNLIPESLASSYQAISYARDGNTVSVATTNPKDLEVIELIRKTIGGVRIVPSYGTPAGIRSALELYKKERKSLPSELPSQSGASPVASIEHLLETAVRDNASDIHIEPLDTETLVRSRIDGVLHDEAHFPRSMHAPMIARIKILSDLKLDETRHPQDGQFSFQTRSGKKISLRVSTIPTVYGEKAVLRILHDAITTFKLEELGLLPEDLRILEKVLRRTHGMILVTGPTGSGKTTSIYTILGLLNKPGANILTIEDPVENRIRRVNQMQVNPLINLTFASGLRSMLRQDPDIIMVGEIRDRETAVIAVNAAMTGHLVFSSVHANTATGVVPRMTELGVEPLLLASTLHLVLAQRLVRILCPKCKSKIPLSPVIESWIADAGDKIDPAIGEKLTVNYQARGCAACHRTGFTGRIGIFELFDIDDEMRQMIIDHSGSDALWKAARKKHAKTMLEDGLLKVINGTTTIEEVFRVISA